MLSFIEISCMVKEKIVESSEILENFDTFKDFPLSPIRRAVVGITNTGSVCPQVVSNNCAKFG